MALRILATGKITAGSEIQWRVAPLPATLEEQLDQAIERTAQQITSNRQVLKASSQHDMDLAWEEMQQQPSSLRLFSDEELRAMEEEQPGADLRYGGW